MPSNVRLSAIKKLTLAAAASVLVCTTLAIWLDLENVRTTRVENFADTLRILAATAFFGAGLLRISRWRMSHERHNALLGVAWVVFGGLTFPLSNVAVLLHTSGSAVSLSPLSRLITTMVALTFIALALRGRGAADELRPGVMLAVAVGAALVCFGALLVDSRWAHDSVNLTVHAHVLLELAMGVAWLAAAAVAAWRGRHEPWAESLAPLLATLASVETLRAAAVFHLVPWELGAAALSAAVGGIALRCALGDLFEATNQEQHRIAAVQEALVRTEDALSAQDAWREELTHDARNALTGLRAALLTLQRYDEQLDAATADRLRSAVLGEVGHLEHLIERSDRDDPVEFDLLGVVRPVVDARRAAGLDVRLESVPCRALGRPGDLATALQNLLVNAEHHAPGGTVTVRLKDLAHRVEIHVEDSGPGVPAQLGDVLFSRGVRGQTSSGSGLGLYVARTLMRHQDGDLEVRPGRGEGAVFVLSLRAAAPGPAQSRMLLPQQRRPVDVSTVEQPMDVPG